MRCNHNEQTLTILDRKLSNNKERKYNADTHSRKLVEAVFGAFLKRQSKLWGDGVFSSMFTASVLSLLIKPAAAQNPRNENPGISNGRDEPRLTEWIIGGLLVGLCVLVLASICKNPGDTISQRPRPLSAPAMTLSSVLFLLFRNGDPTEAKMAWA
jgi:hypothetical protein